jgi:DNA polymerase III subunit epsilon
VTAFARPSAPKLSARRAPWRSVDLVALDFEATGIDFERDTIISFGAVPIRQGRIEIGDCLYELVHPGEIEPSRESIVVHGLRPLDLVDAPSLESAKAALSSVMEGRFLVVWWAPVEAGFLNKLFGGGTRSWLRRAVDVRDLLIGHEGTGASGLTLTEAAERYGVPVVDPHQALDDALVTAQLFMVMAAKLASRATSFGALRRLSPAFTEPSPAPSMRGSPRR